jgi:hypothetical protein
MEVTVTAAIAAVLAFTMAQMGDYLRKMIKGVEKSSDWIDLKNAVRSGLSTNSNCSRLLTLPSLGLSSANMSSVPTISGSTTSGQELSNGVNIGSAVKGQSGANLLIAGSQYSGLRVLDVELRDPLQDKESSDFRWTAKLFIRVGTRKSDSIQSSESLGVQEYSHSYPVAFYVTATNPAPTSSTAFDSCVGLESDASVLKDDFLDSVPKSGWVVGFTQPYDCYAQKGSEIQGCLDLASNKGITNIYIKEGTYNDVVGLNIPAGMKVRGAGT